MVYGAFALALPGWVMIGHSTSRTRPGLLLKILLIDGDAVGIGCSLKLVQPLIRLLVASRCLFMHTWTPHAKRM